MSYFSEEKTKLDKLEKSLMRYQLLFELYEEMSSKEINELEKKLKELKEDCELKYNKEHERIKKEIEKINK